jgi:phosphatidylinositol alpha-mannosyltransferase
VQTHIRDTSEALRELGHEVAIITPRVGQMPERDGDVWRIGRAIGAKFAGTAFELSAAFGTEARRLQSLMQGFDVVHYHAIWTPVLPMQALLASGAPSVATVHDTPPDTLVGAFARGVLPHVSRMMLPLFDRVVTVSAAPRAHLRPAPGQSISIIPPCTDLSRFFSAEGRSRAEDEPPTILFLGRLEPRKGCGLLLEAYRRLCDEGLKARLVIVGGGAEEPALRRTATEHGLQDVVFAGRLSDAEALQHYADCDIFCAPAPYGESFGIVIAEAMSAGKPVVAAANPGYSTVLAGEQAGRLTAPGDPGALHRALKELVLDPGLRRRLGEQGKADAAQYDCRAVAPRLLAVYREAILAHDARDRRRRFSGVVTPADEPVGL